jgi:hypothetical protein
MFLGRRCLADLLKFWKAAAGGHLSAAFLNLFMDYNINFRNNSMTLEKFSEVVFWNLKMI